MALLILALLQRIFLMSSLMLLLVWLIFFMVLIKLLPILGTISGKTVKLMVLALDRKSGSAGMPRPISYAVFCLKKKNRRGIAVQFFGSLKSGLHDLRRKGSQFGAAVQS